MDVSSSEASKTSAGMPTVSVVVACYRRGEILRECLESVRAQGFRDWEAIVVDDGTPSPEVNETVTELADARIRYVRHPMNLGLAAARNTGFRQATAALVLPLDSDDRLACNFLEKTVRALTDDPAADCVYTDFQMFGDSEEVRHHRVASLEDMLQVQWIPGPGTLQRKTVWESVGGYCEPPVMGQEFEWDFWISAYERGLRAVHIPEPLYLYRRHSDAMSAGSKLRDYSQREAIYSRHKATLKSLHFASQFRAGGYLKSATAYLRRGQRIRSMRLTFRGLYLAPMHTKLWRHLIKTLLPAALVERIIRRHVALATQRQRGRVSISDGR